jgi:hypothetical protein
MAFGIYVLHIQKIGSPMNQARSISKDWKSNESGTLNIKRLEAQ